VLAGAGYEVVSNRQHLRPPRRRGDYLAPLLDAHAAGLMPPGTFTVAEIRHDADCPRPDGGPCTCHADVELVIRPLPKEPRRG
jgi:hypothetical protein